MEILAYDPYHIGIKISPQFPIEQIRKKLLPKLRSSEFLVDVNDEIPTNIQHEVEVIAKDENNRIEFNYKLHALNTEGEDPIKTTNTFKKLLEVIGDSGFELKGIAPTIDIVTNVFVKTDSSPNELINNSIKCDLTPWSEINEEAKFVNGLKIDLIDEKYGKESLRIIIGSSSLNPTTQLALTIRYLHIETQPIIDFGENLQNRVIKFINSLGD